MSEDTEVTQVYFIWEEVSPDPVQYKPYSPKFSPINVAVMLEVPDEFIVSWEERLLGDETYVVLSPDGMAWCAERLSRGITNIKTGVVR